MQAMTDREMGEFLRDTGFPPAGDAQGRMETDLETGTAVRMTDPEAIRKFVLAGNAYFTLTSLKTGVRYTYRVSKAKPNPNYRQLFPTYFVSVLTGSDNVGSYTYAGLLQDLAVGWGLRQTRGSKVSSQAPSYKAIEWFLGRLLNRKGWEMGVSFCHAGKCGRCGRLLTVPSSVEAGLGPECAGKGMA